MRLLALNLGAPFCFSRRRCLIRAEGAPNYRVPEAPLNFNQTRFLPWESISCQGFVEAQSGDPFLSTRLLNVAACVLLQMQLKAEEDILLLRNVFLCLTECHNQLRSARRQDLQLSSLPLNPFLSIHRWHRVPLELLGVHLYETSICPGGSGSPPVCPPDTSLFCRS